MSIKNIIVSLVLMSSLIGFPTQLIAQPLEIVNPKTIPQLISYYSEKYNVSEELMTDMIACETSNTNNPSIQSNIRYNFSDSKRGIVKGEREKSFGLAQIHLPDHPEVTYEQATNADFAIQFMAREISEGHANIWSCYKLVK